VIVTYVTVPVRQVVLGMGVNTMASFYDYDTLFLGTSLKSNMSFGTKFLNKKGEDVDAATALADAEVVLLYFSAHWCPPCRGFTPILKDFYEEVEDKHEGKLVVIFVSSDRDEGEMMSYFKESHGDYYCMPHNSEEGKKLKQMCGVQGIPTLAQVSKSGTELIEKNCRGLVQSNQQPTAVFKIMQEKTK